MIENTLKEPISKKVGSEVWSPEKRPRAVWSLKRGLIGCLLCGLGFLCSLLLTMTPLMRLPDPVIRLSISSGAWLAQAGSWLPINLGLASDPLDAQGSTAYLEFFLLIFLAFAFYVLAAWLMMRSTTAKDQRFMRGLIWSGAILSGLIYLVTPAMLSHDILAYASYGRILITYHSNPYFTPISAFPHDPFTPLNYWASIVSAYGPAWTLICGFWSLFLGPNPLFYVLAYRLSALATQLLNIWLVGRILRSMGQSPRAVTLGMLLYAWNPLVVLESGLSAHNDVLMVTFMLSGILLAVRAEARGQILRPSGYLPPIVVLSLAALVKFTALPILAVYLIFLVCKIWRSTPSCKTQLKEPGWRPASVALAWSMLVAIAVSLALYGPFWFGHSWQSIIASFNDQPSALFSENSWMRATADFLLYHPADRQNGLLLILSDRHYWDDLNYGVIALFSYLGAGCLWRQPTVRTFVLVSLAMLGAIMLITPWFFSWYILWILSLAVLCLPTRAGRIESALLAFTLAISFSALLTYLFKNGYQPLGIWTYVGSTLITLPPACAFLLTLVLWQPERSQVIRKAEQ